jgi:hypothetical protein
MWWLVCDVMIVGTLNVSKGLRRKTKDTVVHWQVDEDNYTAKWSGDVAETYTCSVGEL